MQYVRFLLIPFFLFFGITFLLEANAGLESGISAGLPTQGASPDFEALEKELEEASKVIDEYVASLPPEEQMEFKKAVEKLTEEIENMSPEEFEEFFGEVFGEELPFEEKETKEEVEKEIKEEEVITEPEIKEERGKQSQAILLIDAIITYTNSFLVTIASSPDLPGKIEFWGKEGTIKEWPSTLVWKDFKEQLENFSQQLHKIKDQDSTTKKYKYLDDLIKDESLYNNLTQLKTKISHYIPKIEIPEFGLEKLTTESKQAVQKAVNTYTESLYTLKIPQELTKLFEKFEPIAKKLKTEEEETEKKAAAQAKQTKAMPERALVAGREMETGYSYGYPGSPSAYRSTYPTYPSSAYTSPYGSTTRFSTKVEPIDRKKMGKPGKTPIRSSGPGKPGGEKLEEIEKKEAPVKLEKKDPDAERLLGKIEANLKEIDRMIETNEKFKSLEKQLASGDAVDQSLAIIEIPAVRRRVNEVTSDIKALGRKVQLLGSTPKKYYKEELQSLVDKNKKPLKEIMDVINTIEEKINTDAAFAKNVSDEKKYVYLGDEQAIERLQKRAPAEAKTIKDEIPHPTSLYEFRDVIEDLLKTTKDFGGEKKKSPASVYPGVSVRI